MIGWFVQGWTTWWWIFIFRVGGELILNDWSLIIHLFKLKYRNAKDYKSMFKMGDFGLNYKLNQFELVYTGFNWLKTVWIGSNRFEMAWNIFETGWNPFWPVVNHGLEVLVCSILTTFPTIGPTTFRVGG